MSRFIVLAAFTLISAISFAFVNKNPSPSISKSLAFPVWGKKSNIGSFWGDARDGGRRKHKGIDIFAKKGTPVVAICDGIIVSRGNTPRGGKTLWLQATGYAFTAYYAHLNEQKVRVGQFVKKGEVIGTVGNTGNARTTPPHLHFGIYTWLGGAINPLPYVKNSPKITTPYTPAQPKPAIAKSPKKVIKKAESKEQPAQAYVFPQKYIAKTIVVPADPGAKYYVTTKSNVVRIHKGQLQVVGKWQKSNNSKYPYKIALVNKQQLYVDRSGKLTTSNGTRVGTVS